MIHHFMGRSENSSQHENEETEKLVSGQKLKGIKNLIRNIEGHTNMRIVIINIYEPETKQWC